MARYLDKEGKYLRKGFYKHSDEKQLFYFTGNYDRKRNNIPLFNNENNDVHDFVAHSITYALFTKKLSRIDDDELMDKLNNLQKRINFIQKRLND